MRGLSTGNDVKGDPSLSRTPLYGVLGGGLADVIDKNTGW